MAAIRVKAAKVDDKDTVVFQAEGAGLVGDFPTQGVVKSDGKVVTLDSRHVAVKEALRSGVLVQVGKSSHEAAQPATDAKPVK
jgi:hypothetical protein